MREGCDKPANRLPMRTRECCTRAACALWRSYGSRSRPTADTVGIRIPDSSPDLVLEPINLIHAHEQAPRVVDDLADHHAADSQRRNLPIAIFVGREEIYVHEDRVIATVVLADGSADGQAGYIACDGVTDRV